MKIYILESDNPLTRPNPIVFTDIRSASLAMQDEFEETKSDLGITAEDVEQGTGGYGVYINLNETTGCGNILITDDYSADRWAWRLTEHEISNTLTTVVCPNCRSILQNAEDAETTAPAREWVMAICDAVEDVLEEYDVTVPDEDRTDDESEARLFGTAFDKVANAVTDILTAMETEMKSNPNRTYDFARY